MQFVLTIDLGNEAMQTRGDVADTLHKLAAEIKAVNEGPFSPEYLGLDLPIKDINGNTVGRWEVTGDAPTAASLGIDTGKDGWLTEYQRRTKGQTS